MIDIRKYIYIQKAQEVTFDGLPILLMPWINSQNYVYAMGMIDETKRRYVWVI